MSTRDAYSGTSEKIMTISEMIQICKFELYDFYMFSVDFCTAVTLHSSDLSKLVPNPLFLIFPQSHRNEVQTFTNEPTCEDSNNEYYLSELLGTS